MLAQLNPSAVWVAVDTAIRYEGRGPNALADLLALPRTGQTSLPAALEDLELLNLVIVTDEGGKKQLEERNIKPRGLVLVSGGAVRWQV
jgi:hypothetical protein